MIPDNMPTLSGGKHDPREGKACVMEYVSLLAGEKWSDSPSCTHPVLAAMARNVNDRLLDGERHLLVPLIGRLFGTAETGTAHERQVLNVRLTAWCARRVLEHSGDHRAVALAAIEAAEGWCEGRVTANAAYNAANVAYAAANAYNAYNAAASAAVNAAYAAAAYNAAYYAAAASAAAYAADLGGLLSGLIDEYDRLTGRTEHREVSDAELIGLRNRVAALAS